MKFQIFCCHISHHNSFSGIIHVTLWPFWIWCCLSHLTRAERFTRYPCSSCRYLTFFFYLFCAGSFKPVVQIITHVSCIFSGWKMYLFIYCCIFLCMLESNVYTSYTVTYSCIFCSFYFLCCSGSGVQVVCLLKEDCRAENRKYPVWHTWSFTAAIQRLSVPALKPACLHVSWTHPASLLR